MRLRDKAAAEFAGHSAEARKVIAMPLIQNAAQNIEVNDNHLYPFFTQAWLEGYFIGNKVKLNIRQFNIAHYYLQRVLDLRREASPAKAESCAREMLYAIKDDFL